MAKKLLNPRGYLSWTQIDMWLRNKEKYMARYFRGEKEFENAAMAHGKRTSDALENGPDDEDPVMDALVILLPHYSKREHEIRATLKTPNGVVDLLGKLDTYDPRAPKFREYKTGKVVWTQTRAERHKQLPHYATLIWLFHKKLPKEVWLDWAETEFVSEEVRFTGNIRTFKVNIGMKEILEYIAIASKVAAEIDEEYRKYLKELS